ncbi:MAG: hypothetical protein J6386_15345 [Candidatus Synoicihabitans palmerolidicus]|nr:hypothetical protein [Candidatus Synoicihabitans palmerolidicus]
MAGGGQLINTGIYVIQSALMAKGEEMPVAVTASESPKTRPDYFNEVEETINFVLEWADGSKLEGTSSGVQGSNHFEAESAAHRLRVDPAYSYDGLRMMMDGVPRTPIDGFFQQAAQMDAFAADVINATPSVVPGAMGRRDMRLITAIYEAARMGQRIELRS